MSREIDVFNYSANKESEIYIKFNDSLGFDYSVLIGTFFIDSKGPELNIGYYASFRNSDGIGEGGAEIEVQNWTGWQKPVKVQLSGDINKLFIDGKRFYFDPSKNPQNIYRKIGIESDIGFNRRKVVGYDKIGNRSETYWEFEAVRSKD